MQHDTAFLSFKTASSKLALPLSNVRHVAPVPLLSLPAGAPYFVEGFFDFRGSPVAAIRLDRLLDLEEQRLGIYAPLILLANSNPPIALHVSKVETILKIPASDVQPIGKEETFNGCVVGRISHRNETIYLLSQSRLLLAAEREKLAAHAAMNKRRLDALKTEATHAIQPQ